MNLLNVDAKTPRATMFTPGITCRDLSYIIWFYEENQGLDNIRLLVYIVNMYVDKHKPAILALLI